MLLDPSNPKHQRPLERLRTDVVAWLTTVRSDGQPQSSPVWFLWDGEDFVVYSLPRSPKVPNVRANPLVSFHLEGDGEGGDIVTFDATARVDDDRPPPHEVPEYVEKYHELIERLGYSDEEFGREYSSAIVVTPTRVRVY